MSITIADIEFARTHYDPRGDVLYLTTEGYVGPPYVANCGDEGHNVEWDESGRVIAITIIGARWWLQRDGELRITFHVEDLTQQELAGLGGSAALCITEAELAPALKSAV
jgi:uncharacterized protein YuzE